MTTVSWPMPFIGVHANLASWKEFANLLHTTLLANGWVNEPTAGQLDIDSVGSLTVGTFYGFKEYRYLDSYDSISPILMRLDYGYGKTSWSAGTSPAHIKIRCRVSDSNLFAPTRTFQSTYPSSQLITSNISPETFPLGQTYICREESIGFFGMVLGANSLSAVTGDTNVNAVISLMIQRNLDNNMNVIPGFSVYGGPGTAEAGATMYAYSMVWSMRNISPDFCHSTNQVTHAPRPFEVSQTSLGSGIFQVAPVFTQTPEIKQVPSLLTYVSNQITPGTTFEVETPWGVFTYIALGNSNMWQNITGNSLSNTHARVGMLWQ